MIVVPGLSSIQLEHSKGIVKNIFKIVCFFSTGYLLLAFLLFLFQRSLIYYPSEYKPSTELALQKNLRFWPTYGDYRGFTQAVEPVDIKGTVIVFHGNAGTAYHRSYYADALSRNKLRVILAEYPGYGGRDGEPSEAAVVSDAHDSLRLANETYGEPLYLWGESLGSGVVASLVAQTEIPIKGLVLLLPWDSLANLAQEHYWYLPTRWLLLDDYNSIDNLREFEGNIAVMLAEKDKVIPTQHGRKLYESLNTNKKLLIFKGAGHNSLPMQTGMSWWKEVSDFVAQ